MRILRLVTLAGLALVAACSAEKQMARPLSVPEADSFNPDLSSAGTVINERLITGVVEDFAAATGELIVRSAEGTTISVVLVPELDGVDGIDQGDQVTLAYREWMSFQVKKANQANLGVAHTTDVTRAPRAEGPGSIVTETVNVRVPIAAIDARAAAFIVRNPSGDVLVIKVNDPRALDEIAVGDVMDMAYTTAVAITVRKAPSPVARSD
jgi:hypothetical protein